MMSFALTPAAPSLNLLDGAATFRLAEMEALHASESHSLALDDVFGDALLLRRVPTLERLRHATVGYGYRFVPHDELSAAHSVMPLVQLAEILDQKTIPYRRSAPAARELLARAPEMRFDELTFRDSFEEIRIPHESAHAVFWELARAAEGPLAGRRLVEVLVASEGFAIGFDTYVVLATLACASRSTMRFLSVNTPADPYGFGSRERKEPGLLRRLVRLVTERPAETLRLMCIGCFVSNVRPTAAAAQPELVRRLSAHAGLGPEWHEEATALIAATMCTDVQFRKRTAPTFFRQLGLEAEFEAFCAAPLEESFRAPAAFYTYLPLACALVLDEPEDSR